MTTLRIQVMLYGDRRIGTTKVVANVFSVGRRGFGEASGTSVRNLLVNAGDEDHWTEVEVEPGHYEVQVEMPSGQLLNEEIEVPAEGASLPLCAPSAHEWLAAQSLQGNISTRPPVEPELNWAPKRSRSARAWGGFSRSKGGGAPTRVRWCAAAVGADTQGADTLFVVDDIVSDRSAVPAADFFLDHHGTRNGIKQAPSYADELVGVYRFGPELPGGFGSQTRAYALVEQGGLTTLAVLPLPWRSLEDLEEVAFELMAARGGQGVAAAIHDPLAASVVGYLSSNDPESARRLVDRAEDLLFHKVDNPFAAAAGVYTLLATERERKYANWHQWIENLYRRFDDIPDGAIAYATLKLEYQRSDADVEEALEALGEACTRGIPYYSIGFRLLLDGLRMFAADPGYASRHEEIESCLDVVTRVASRVNYQQAFTCIELS